MTTTILICDTCKRPDHDETAPQCDGERLAAMVEAAVEGRPGLRVRRHSCLMGCGKGCNLAIRAAGKMTYVLGDFEAIPDHAEAIADYASLHAASDSGQVPFRQWPQGVKGHFVSRLPDQGSDDT
ncbi:MAG: DUF1636 domain-containing protein [Rhodobacteraceae bacterium]|nr:DUF1636 domain-containing protein [Paracoccaceae bacterium]